MLCADDNYDRFNAALLAELDSLGPQALEFILNGVLGTNNLKRLVESGDRNAIVQSLLDGAAATKAGAYHALSNPALYRLDSVIGPYELQQLAYDVAAGIKNGQDVTNAYGLFTAQVREALKRPWLV